MGKERWQLFILDDVLWGGGLKSDPQPGPDHRVCAQLLTSVGRCAWSAYLTLALVWDLAFRLCCRPTVWLGQMGTTSFPLAQSF